MSGVFISYRRDDSGVEARRVADDLRRKFGYNQVFLDVDDIDPGVRFEEVIDARLAEIDAFVPIIGPDWVSARDHQGRLRLFDQHDHVRQEIAHALSSGVAVVPVLVDGAMMPREDQLPPDLQSLCAINALVAESSDLGDDVDRLARALKDDLTVRTIPSRAGGGFLYSWTGLVGVFTFILVMSLQSCQLFPVEGEPAPPNRPLGLTVVVLVFALGLGTIILIRRAMRARRGARRVTVTVLLYVIAPVLMVAAAWLAFVVDPNPK